MAVNGKIDPPSSDIKGSENARNHFYPNDLQIKNDFVFIFGEFEKLQAYLDTLKILPYDLKKKVHVYFNTEYIPNKADIDANGKKTTDTFKELILTDTRTAQDDAREA